MEIGGATAAGMYQWNVGRDSGDACQAALPISARFEVPSALSSDASDGGKTLYELAVTFATKSGSLCDKIGERITGAGEEQDVRGIWTVDLGLTLFLHRNEPALQ